MTRRSMAKGKKYSYPPGSRPSGRVRPAGKIRMPKVPRPKKVRNPDYYVLRDESGRAVYGTESKSSSSKRNIFGKLVLTPQPYWHRHYRARFMDQSYVNCSGFESGLMPNSLGDTYTDTTEVYNRAYGSLMKKLHYQDASLGMTLGTLDQSMSMLGTRLKQLHILLKGVTTRRGAKKLRRELGRALGNSGFAGKNYVKRAADTHLEKIFGWDPLMQDISSTLGVLASGEPDGFLTGRGRVFNASSTTQYAGYVQTKTEKNLIIKCSVSCFVKVENSNKWMDNRLGLANPTLVLWDRVPWSFVVGMFANINQCLKAYTATYGLTVTDVSATYSIIGFIEQTATFNHWLYPQLTAPAKATCSFRTKRRELLGAIPRPSLIWNLPPLTVDTAIMASALVVQQLFRIGKLF